MELCQRQVPHQGQKQCVIVKHTFLHVETVPDCASAKTDFTWDGFFLIESNWVWSHQWNMDSFPGRVCSSSRPKAQEGVPILCHPWVGSISRSDFRGSNWGWKYSFFLIKINTMQFFCRFVTTYGDFFLQEILGRSKGWPHLGFGQGAERADASPWEVVPGVAELVEETSVFWCQETTREIDAKNLAALRKTSSLFFRTNLVCRKLDVELLKSLQPWEFGMTKGATECYLFSSTLESVSWHLHVGQRITSHHP